MKRELEEAEGSLTRMAFSTKKFDHMLGVGKSPCDKKGLGFEDGKVSSTTHKTVFVKNFHWCKLQGRRLIYDNVYIVHK